MLNYFARITKGKIVLWCYLIWYCVALYFYFDASVRIWLNSLGISCVIGVALMLSVSRADNAKPDHWQTFRLFAMPFCVSSFSSLIKGQGFIFIVPPKPIEQMAAVGSCLAFIVFILLVKAFVRKAAS